MPFTVNLLQKQLGIHIIKCSISHLIAAMKVTMKIIYYSSGVFIKVTLRKRSSSKLEGKQKEGYRDSSQLQKELKKQEREKENL